MITSKDDAVNLVALARYPFTFGAERYCAKCGCRLTICVNSQNDCYLVSCRDCNTRTVVQAGSADMALNIVGIEKTEEPNEK